MIIAFLALSAAFFIIVIVQFFWMNKSLSQQNQFIHQQLQSFNQNISSVMTDTRQSVQSDLKTSGELISHIHHRLGEISQMSERIKDVGQNIVDFQELLKSPKIRGGMGEYFLQDLLAQILPQSAYQTQYVFKDGQMVDAILQIGPNKICIDAKFPLENFKAQLEAENEKDKVKNQKEFIRMVKKHIDDISTKYILPNEGTYDFALMYIPAENIYYETIIRLEGQEKGKSLFEYSIHKRVIPVSPNSIYAYLQVILLGLKGFQIEAKTKEIIGQLSGLQLDVKRFESDFNLVGKHILNTGKTFEKAQNRFSKFSQQLDQIGAGELVEKEAKSARITSK